MRRHMFSRARMLFLTSLFAFAIAFAAVLTVPCVAASNVRIQLCMVIDGSGSINSTEWALIVQAVAEGLTEIIPHDGSVEFTIVQFGSSNGQSARTEMAPTIIDNATCARARWRK